MLSVWFAVDSVLVKFFLQILIAALSVHKIVGGRKLQFSDR